MVWRSRCGLHNSLVHLQCAHFHFSFNNYFLFLKENHVPIRLILKSPVINILKTSFFAVCSPLRRQGGMTRQPNFSLSIPSAGIPKKSIPSAGIPKKYSKQTKVFSQATIWQTHTEKENSYAKFSSPHFPQQTCTIHYLTG